MTARGPKLIDYRGEVRDLAHNFAPDYVNDGSPGLDPMGEFWEQMDAPTSLAVERALR